MSEAKFRNYEWVFAEDRRSECGCSLRNGFLYLHFIKKRAQLFDQPALFCFNLVLIYCEAMIRPAIRIVLHQRNIELHEINKFLNAFVDLFLC